MGTSVGQGEVEGHEAEELEGAVELEHLLLLLGEAEAVDEPAEHRAQDLVVQQVHGEGHAAEPQEEAVREHGARHGREVQPDDDDVEAEARGEAREVRVGGQDGGEEFAERLRPGLPVVVVVGEGGDKEADKEEEDAHSAADGAIGGRALETGEGSGIEVLQVSHEGAEEELHAEEGVVASPAEHGETERDGHAVLLLDVGRGDEEDVHPEGALEDGHHGPELGAVFTPTVRPHREEVLDHGAQRQEDVVPHVGTGLGQTVSITVVRNLESTQLRRKAGQGDNNSHGEDKSRNSSNRRAAHGSEGLGLLTLVEVLDGLEGADITGDETEDGDSDAALDEDAEIGQLQQHGGGLFVGGGVEEVGEPGGSEMLDDDEGGGDAAKALNLVSVHNLILRKENLRRPISRFLHLRSPLCLTRENKK